MSDEFKICDNCSSSSNHCVCDKCANCSKILVVPYIECTQCKNTQICCKCFASGCEFLTHENNHNYRVIRHDLELFPSSTWTASEELCLLNILFTYGYGNWELVRDQLKNRSSQEIKLHYDHFYLNKPVFSELPQVPETQQSLFPQILVPYRVKLNYVEEPPRYSFGSVGYQSVAGYNAPRGDFDTEFNATAEQCLVALNMCPDNDPLLMEYICGVTRIYNRHLRERQRRKDIIRRHGLILMRKTNSWMHRYDKSLTRHRTERLMSFMQFFDGEGFELFMEGLHRAAELKQRIAKLNEYRNKGITTLQAADVYDAINAEKQQYDKDLHSFVSQPRLKVDSFEESYNKPQIPAAPTTTNKRGNFRPLDIVGLPGFEKLSKQEQELCKSVRLVPQTYLDLKLLLITENKKLGYLHLKTARKMLKIDVNKTRKLYDFLITEGFITKPTVNN